MALCFRWGKTGIFTDEVAQPVEKPTTLIAGFK